MKQSKINFFVICIFTLFAISLNAHTHKVPIIVDTDMAIDDSRAIIMLLNLHFCDLQLVVTSDGALSPKVGRKNLKLLFSYLKKDNILIAAGRKLKKNSPLWRVWSEQIFSSGFGKKSKNRKKILYAPKIIVNKLNSMHGKTIYLCMGPLTNLADAMKIDPNIKKKISRVIYYGSIPNADKPDWNTNRDLISAKAVFNSGLKIYALNNSNISGIKFSKNFFNKIKNIDTPSSRAIIKLHNNKTIKELLQKEHFRIWDEISVIYMNEPSLFSFTRINSYVSVVNKYDPKLIYKQYLKLLGYQADSHLYEREVVVLNNFPVKPIFFKPDFRENVKKIIKKYGLEEWKACVLTNELHRHLGIYSIIGAKMGIYAREILGAPLDSMDVISYAGNKPPLSCMNDGLQVSTGASLGRGTIKIIESDSRPEVLFVYKNKKLKLKVKEDTIKKIKNDIQTSLKKFGGLNKEYFKHIRKLSIRYWYELDRKKIFEKI